MFYVMNLLFNCFRPDDVPLHQTSHGSLSLCKQACRTPFPRQLLWDHSWCRPAIYSQLFSEISQSRYQSISGLFSVKNLRNRSDFPEEPHLLLLISDNTQIQLSYWSTMSCCRRQSEIQVVVKYFMKPSCLAAMNRLNDPQFCVCAMFVTVL